MYLGLTYVLECIASLLGSSFYDTAQTRKKKPLSICTLGNPSPSATTFREPCRYSLVFDGVKKLYARAAIAFFSCAPSRFIVL